MPDWWKKFFTFGRFPIDELMGPEHTAAEVSALRSLLPRPPASVLDVACGTGRHAHALAQAGYEVVGVDQSEEYLRRARRRGGRRRAAYLRRDMRRLGFEKRFDAAVNLWTSFGYFDRPAQDVAALASMRRALKPGGLLILEVVDGAWVRANLSRRSWAPAGRGWLLEESALREGKDPAIVSERIHVGRDGRSRRTRTVVRLYDRARLAGALRRAGFERTRFAPGLIELSGRPARANRLLAAARRPL